MLAWSGIYTNWGVYNGAHHMPRKGDPIYGKMARHLMPHRYRTGSCTSTPQAHCELSACLRGMTPHAEGDRRFGCLAPLHQLLCALKLSPNCATSDDGQDEEGAEGVILGKIRIVHPEEWMESP